MWTGISDFDRMFQNMDLLKRRMERIFPEIERNWAGWPVMTEVDKWPRINFYDDGDCLRFYAEMPGLAEKDVSVKLQGDFLEISGELKAEVPEGYSIHRIEREAKNFSRSFTLPVEVDRDNIKATLKNGILSLTLPKVEAAKPKQITINPA